MHFRIRDQQSYADSYSFTAIDYGRVTGSDGAEMGGPRKGLTEHPHHSLQPAAGGEAPIQPEALEIAGDELPTPSSPSPSTRRLVDKRGGMGVEQENRLGCMGPLEAHFHSQDFSEAPESLINKALCF